MPPPRRSRSTAGPAERDPGPRKRYARGSHPRSPTGSSPTTCSAVQGMVPKAVNTLGTAMGLQYLALVSFSLRRADHDQWQALVERTPDRTSGRTSDEFIETVLIPEYTRGICRRYNPAYLTAQKATKRARKRGDAAAARASRARQHSLPSMDNYDPHYRRLRYVRGHPESGPLHHRPGLKNGLRPHLRKVLEHPAASERGIRRPHGGRAGRLTPGHTPPVVCMDEKPFQLLGQVRDASRPARPKRL